MNWCEECPKKVPETDMKTRAVQYDGTRDEKRAKSKWRTRALSRPGSSNYWEWSRLVYTYKLCRPQNFPKQRSYITMVAQTNGEKGKLNRMGPFIVYLWQSQSMALFHSINYWFPLTPSPPTPLSHLHHSQRTAHLRNVVARPKHMSRNFTAFLYWSSM